MRPVAWLALLLALVAAPRMADAQSSTTEAKYHGILSIRRAAGTIDRTNLTGMIRVQSWTALVTPDTNGLFPDQEPLLISAGDNNDFTLPAGMLKASRSRRSFSYKAPRGSAPRGLRSFRIWLRRDGSYGMRFTLAGIELSLLKNQDPLCMPLAILIGDDDFFNGVTFTSPSFESKRLVVPKSCPISNDDWPWIRG